MSRFYRENVWTKKQSRFPKSLIAICDEMAVLSQMNYSEGPICGRYNRHRDPFCGSPYERTHSTFPHESDGFSDECGRLNIDKSYA